ncbi:MAG: hypothetical protein WCI77_01680 [Candidatus Omnitrophota bacterium]
MRKYTNIVLLLAGAVLFVGIASNFCFAQTENADTGMTAQPSVGAPIQKWLQKKGLSPNVFFRDDYSFLDGDFELAGEITTDIMSGDFSIDDPEILKQAKENIENGNTLFFPWDSKGIAKVVTVEGNAMAEVKTGTDGIAAISQDIGFKNVKAEFTFDVYPVEVNDADILDVFLADFGMKTDGVPSRVAVAKYKLSELSSPEHIVIDFSKNKEVKDFLEKDIEQRFNIICQITARRDEPATVRFDNFKMSY